MSNLSLDLGVAESRIYDSAISDSSLRKKWSMGVSNPPVEDENPVISTFDVLQYLFDLGEITGFDSGPVLERG